MPDLKTRSHDDPAAVRIAEEGERQKAELAAQNRRLEEALAKAHARAESVPPSSRKRARDYAAPGAGLATIVLALLGVLQTVLEQREKIVTLEVQVQTAKLVADEDRKREAARWKHALTEGKAWRCRFQQAASALNRLGYALSDVDYSEVLWVPEQLPKRAGQPTARRAQRECPAFPEPPEP
ncbi:MAG TPA: hypothetical protein VGK73_33325 [Polyangiaceae bacterium]